ncbi:hypothetical protein V6Z11_A04G084200 [Gossypium hirsutum]
MNYQLNMNYYYPYRPVDAQIRAPLYNRICTHSGCFRRAAKCKGVAPLPSLIFTNRAYPLISNPTKDIHIRTNENRDLYPNESKKSQAILKETKDHHKTATGPSG